MSPKNEIPGPERAAAFLLSLEREDALSVMRHLDADLVSEVASAMTELDEKFSEHDTVNKLYFAVSREVLQPTTVQAQSDTQLRFLLEEAFGPERALGVLDDIRQRQLAERPFQDVEFYSPEVLAIALCEETPTSCAIVLSHVEPAYSAEVLGNMEQELALSTVTQMATLVPPGAAALKSMARNLTASLEVINRQPSPADPSARLQTIAQMLNYSNLDLERSVLEGLEEANADMAGEIREFMFTWTDLATVDKRSMQKILGSVDTRTLALALKACTADVEENVAGNLSSRVKVMVLEERELAGAVAMSEVMAARGEIMKAVHALIEAGDFAPARSGQELVT
ncbi:MAG: flagellar motor switch protein FliG [Candidatus Paceibacteria bacterium]|jgi:flagellar motor switch protein FliG